MNRFIAFRVCWSQILVVAVILCGYVAAALPARGRDVNVFAGGVSGVTDLLAPSNSEAYRARGGGLYLHNSGWMTLTPDQQGHILEIFREHPLGIELGFGSGAAWGEIYKSHYGIFNVRPTFIAVNAFSRNNRPTPEQWNHYSAQLREHDVPPSTLILPTFEYQNFTPNISTLSRSEVSLSPDFRAIVQSAGGIVLDTPSGYSMRREPAYRDWVVDAIRWTAQLDLKSIIILSPGSSGNKNWINETDHYVRYLRVHDAMPSSFVCENYNTSKAEEYPNRVGSERNLNNVLGHCLVLTETLSENVDTTHLLVSADRRPKRAYH